jgi:heat-inducible transcriptional repressor
MFGEMTERRRHILKLVIQEYVETSAPVASEHLVRRHGMSVSSATIRNELSALEELGYLTHYHTSAGRVPTDAGYRFFVENLMDRPELPKHEAQAIRQQFLTAQTTLDQWIHMAGSVMARTAQNVSVVLPPRGPVVRLRHVHLVPIHDAVVLVVMVLHDGMVRQQTCVTDAILSSDELQRIANHINTLCQDATANQVRERMDGTGDGHPGVLRQVVELVSTTLRLYDEALQVDIRSDGLLEMFNQPEFAQTERVKQMLELVQSSSALAPLIPQVTQSDGVQVFIGAESQRPDLREVSMVLAKYGMQNEMVGVLGVVGPTRMPYARAIATVRHIAEVMSDLVYDLHGEPRTERDAAQHAQPQGE